MAVKLGDRVKDEVTGFEGIAVARTTWLHGCDRICVQPEKLDKDGKVVDGITFDENQLKVLKSRVVDSHEHIKSTAKTGGPRNDKLAQSRR